MEKGLVFTLGREHIAGHVVWIADRSAWPTNQTTGG